MTSSTTPLDNALRSATVSAWGNYHALAILAGVGASITLATATPLAFAAAASFTMLWHRGWPELARLRPSGGYANYATAARLLLILCIGFAMNEITRSWVYLVFAANVILDVVDGHLARRSGQTTWFGAVFDREVDALFVLVAYLYFYFVDGIAGWILLPGALPYAYRLVVWKFGAPAAAETKVRVAAWMAGFNYVLLLFAIAAPIQSQLYVLIASTGLVTFSFLVSSWMVQRHARSIS
jgi:phosphatidylglycerophosphate synthase